ncbi:MAG: hypothetical protein ACRCTZ_12585 [Sarcina sp.]
MVTHKKTKKKRILMMKMKKIIAKEISNRVSKREAVTDSNSRHK